jgi:hypothetical protein
MTITVSNTNDAPVLVEADGISLEGLAEYSIVANEDEELTVELLAHDDDLDPLVFYVDDARLEITQPGGAYTAHLSYTPTNDELGLIFVTVSVWDFFNTFDELVINITVVNINDPPVIQTFEAQDARGVEELTFTLYEAVLFKAPIVVLDIDSMSLEFEDSQDILDINIDPLNPMQALATYTPTQDEIGQIITTLEVRDGDGGLDALNIVFEVLGTNDDPGIPDLTHLGGEVSLTAKLSATQVTDPDGDTDLTYTWDFGDHSAPVAGVGLVLVEHTYAQDGTYIVTLTVSDGNGGSSMVQKEVIILPPEDVPEDTKVEEGPVVLVAALLVALAVFTVIALFLYWRLPRRGTG